MAARPRLVGYRAGSLPYKSRYVGRRRTKAHLQLTAVVANLTLTTAWLEATSEGISLRPPLLGRPGSRRCPS